jgi:hypothetical protein
MMNVPRGTFELDALAARDCAWDTVSIKRVCETLPLSIIVNNKSRRLSLPFKGRVGVGMGEKGL